MLATGTAFFKPSIQGSLAHNLTKANSSVGWGVFYWVVNVGAFIGHYLPTILLGLSVLLPGPFHAAVNSPEAWRNLFLASAVFTSFNLLLLFAFQDVPSGASKTETVCRCSARTLRDVFEPRLLAWLAIMSCFWLMMYPALGSAAELHRRLGGQPGHGRAAALAARRRVSRAGRADAARADDSRSRCCSAANSLFIILGVIGVAWLTRQHAHADGHAVRHDAGHRGRAGRRAGPTSAWILVLGILFFSLGEMATGPKKSEYLALIAPPGKKGLYLGYVNIPVGVGVYAGSKIAGYVYGHYGEKAVLALRYLAEQTPFGAGRAGTAT